MPTISNIKGLEQARAKFAFQCAKNAATSYKAKEYKGYAKKFPMMIKSSGLGAALAFAYSKKKKLKAWELLYDHLESWTKQPHKIYLLGNFSDKDLAEAAIELDSSEYRALTVEILAFLNWLRRFSEGLIEGDAEENN